VPLKSDPTARCTLYKYVQNSTRSLTEDFCHSGSPSMLSVARAVFHPRFTRRSSGFVAISVLFSLPTSSSYFSAASNDFCRTRSFLSGTMEVEQFPCLDDNYGYIIHDPGTGETAAIDTPEASKYTEGKYSLQAHVI